MTVVSISWHLNQKNVQPADNDNATHTSSRLIVHASLLEQFLCLGTHSFQVGQTSLQIIYDSLSVENNA